MYSLILISVVSLVLALVLTPVLRDLFARWGVVDRPDGSRKLHQKPIARMGGVPIMLAYLGSYGILLQSPLVGGHIVRAGIPDMWRLLPAVSVVFAVGLVDDIRGLKPWQKLVGQSIAAAFAIMAGVQMAGVGGMKLPPLVAIIGTAVWLIGCTNAVNLIDGMDGLAAGIALLATLTTLIGGLAQGNMALAYATAPMAGALLGFLRYNFNPASVYLGDSGSLTLGFLLGCYSILWNYKAPTMVGMTAPLLALAVPLADAGLAIVRRFLRQQPLFAADRGHIHHRLLALGLTPKHAVFLLYGVVGACAWVSLAVGLLHKNLAEPLLFLFVIAVVVAINLLKYVEFGTARKLLQNGAFLKLLNAQISLDEVVNQVTKSSTLDECWRHLAAAYTHFGFSSVELRTNGRLLCDRLVDAGDEPGWQVQLDLRGHGEMVLRRNADSHGDVTLAAGFVEMLGKLLPEKLAEFQQAASAAAASEQTEKSFIAKA